MMRWVAVLALVLWAEAGAADDHKHVAWDALEPDKAYMIRTEVRSQTFYQTTLHGVVVFPGGGFFKVYERRMHEGILWYRAKWIKPRTIGSHGDFEGWMRADQLQERGAYVVRGYD